GYGLNLSDRQKERLRRINRPPPKIQKSPAHSAKQFLWRVLDRRSEREVILHAQAIARSLLRLSVSQKLFCYGVVFLDFPPRTCLARSWLPAWLYPAIPHRAKRTYCGKR